MRARAGARWAGFALAAALLGGCQGGEPVDGASPTPATEATTSVYAQARGHEARVYARVSGVAVGDGHVVLEVGLTNAGDGGIELAARGASLRDDRGGVHRLVAPVGDPALAVPAATLLEGRLVFTGALDPEATELTLTLNDGSEGGTPGSDRRNDPTPYLEVRIPLPGQAPQESVGP